MSALYTDDVRVRQISGSEYRLPDRGGEWVVLRENDRWNAYDQVGVYCPAASNKDSADEAIHAVIGPAIELIPDEFHVAAATVGGR
jgi:hypothetical protein